MKIAVIGAGLSGLTVATELKDVAEVSVYEKARGVGGRMSTRYADPYQFDHGAQYFTAQTAAFQNFLKPYLDEGSVKIWRPMVQTLQKGKETKLRQWRATHHVGAPKQNSFIKAILAKGQDITLHIGTRIIKVERQKSSWQLTDDKDDMHHFDWVISAIPQPQLLELFDFDFKDRDKVEAVPMVSNFALMLGLEEKVGVPWQAAEVKKSPIGWMALNHTKPDRGHDFSLYARTNHRFGNDYWEHDRDDIQDILIKEIEELLSLKLPERGYQALHGWRYAKATKFMSQPFVIDEAQKMAIAGDWCVGCRVESGFLSSSQLIDFIKDIKII